MKIYQLKIDNEFMKKLKVESAKAEKTIKQFIIDAVNEKLKNDNNKTASSK